MEYEAIYTCYASQQSLLLQKGHRRGTTTKTFLKYWLIRPGGRFVNGLLSVIIFAEFYIIQDKWLSSLFMDKCVSFSVSHCPCVYVWIQAV